MPDIIQEVIGSSSCTPICESITVGDSITSKVIEYRNKQHTKQIFQWNKSRQEENGISTKMMVFLPLVPLNTTTNIFLAHNRRIS